jgi:glycerol-1-phosphate dehydrogenase [NAD(P)+]
MPSVTPPPRVAVPTFGRDLVSQLPGDLFLRPIVATQPEPWALVAVRFPAGRTHAHMVQGMERARIEAEVAALPAGSAVFGIGGGSAVDFAKLAAWRLGLPLVLVPSILSVDAAFTKSLAWREGARVRYVGAVFPEHLLVDFGLLEAAPPVLHRAGVGDVLSIFTALWDWREAHARLGEAYDPGVAREAETVLARLLGGARELGRAREEGLRLLAELYLAEVVLCERVGSPRPEEGSEHILAYCLEARTGRSFLHGQLVGLCALLVGRLQGQDVTPIRAFLDAVGLDCSPAAVGLTREELRDALLSLPAFLAEERQLLPGVFHFRGVPSGDEVERLLDST